MCWSLVAVALLAIEKVPDDNRLGVVELRQMVQHIR
jgi:hypothetical protein